MRIEYETLYDYDKKYIKFVTAKTNADTYYNTLRYDNGNPTTLTKEDIIEITFKVEENDIKGDSSLGFAQLLSFGSKQNLRVIERYNGIVISGLGVNINFIKDDFGIITSIPYNKWITVNFSLLEQSTSTPLMFQSTKPDIKISINSLRIKDEIFNFKEDYNTKKYFISDSGCAKITPTVRFGIAYNPIVEYSDYALSNKLLVKRENSVLKAIIYNNIITPAHFGFDNTLNNNLEFINDATDILQSCFDSPYSVEIPPANYYITKGLTISRPKEIKMFGIDINVLDYQTFESYDAKIKENFINQKSNTVIYSDKNIHYLSIQSSNVKIVNGIIYTGLSLDHDKSSIRYDVRYRIWGGDINMGIIGSYMNIINNKKGTLGIYINADESAQTDYAGNLTMVNIKAVIHLCKIGVYLPRRQQSDKTWYNSINFDINMKACQKFYEVFSLSICTFKGVLQDETMLESGTEEENYYGVNLETNHSDIDIFTIDRHLSKDYQGKNYISHRYKNIRIEGSNNTIGAKTKRHILDRSLVADIFTKEITNNFKIAPDRTKIIQPEDKRLRFTNPMGCIVILPKTEKIGQEILLHNKCGEAQTITFRYVDGDATIEAVDCLLTIQDKGYSILEVIDIDKWSLRNYK